MFFRKVPDFRISKFTVSYENLELGDLPILDFMPDFLWSRKGEKCIKSEVPLRFHEFYEDIWKQNSVHEKKSQILCVIQVELLGLGIVSNPHFPEIFLIEENWAWNLNSTESSPNSPFPNETREFRNPEPLWKCPRILTLCFFEVNFPRLFETYN